MTKNHFITTLALFSFFTLISASAAYAGGGAVHPENFSDSQQIAGKSFSPEISIKDPDSNWTTPLVGKEYFMRSHGDLSGASCDTTQRVTDGGGKIRANCKADAFGRFVFDVVNASGSNVEATFEVNFTDSNNLSGSGFQEQGTQGTYTVSISPGSLSPFVNSTFTVEAILKKDGQVTTNYDDVDFFRWDVLQGGMVTAPGGEAKYRVSNWRAPQVGKTVIRVTAMMKDGRQIQSGAVTVNMLPLPTQTPVATARPTSSPAATSAPTSITTPTATPKSSPSLTGKSKTATTPSPSATATASAQPDSNAQLQQEVQQLHQQVQEQQEQLSVLQKVVKKINDFFSRMFGN